MHLHLHLKDLLDYGPVNAFWLFSFERFNFFSFERFNFFSLERFNRVFTPPQIKEIQLMRKFISQQKVKDLNFPQEYKELYEVVFGDIK